MLFFRNLDGVASRTRHPLQSIISKVGSITGLMDTTYILHFTGNVTQILDTLGLAVQHRNASAGNRLNFDP
jgi:hypothetical protein